MAIHAALAVAVSGAPLLVTERLELWLPAQRRPVRRCTRSSPIRRRAASSGPTRARADHFERFCRNAGSWLLYGYGSFMLRERGSGELIGNAGVFHSFRGLGEDFDDSPEAGWILRADRVGQGLAREAMAAALAWFEREHGRAADRVHDHRPATPRVGSSARPAGSASPPMREDSHARRDGDEPRRALLRAGSASSGD